MVPEPPKHPLDNSSTTVSTAAKRLERRCELIDEPLSRGVPRANFATAPARRPLARVRACAERSFRARLRYRRFSLAAARIPLGGRGVIVVVLGRHGREGVGDDRFVARPQPTSPPGGSAGKADRTAAAVGGSAAG